MNFAKEHWEDKWVADSGTALQIKHSPFPSGLAHCCILSFVGRAPLAIFRRKNLSLSCSFAFQIFFQVTACESKKPQAIRKGLLTENLPELSPFQRSLSSPQQRSRANTENRISNRSIELVPDPLNTPITRGGFEQRAHLGRTHGGIRIEGRSSAFSNSRVHFFGLFGVKVHFQLNLIPKMQFIFVFLLKENLNFTIHCSPNWL